MSTAVLERKRSSTSVDKNLPARRYRPELHGVRGLAILGVVLFHLFGNGRVAGGIDLFLTISGFLFTAMLLRHVTERVGVINFARYFGRLLRSTYVPAANDIVATVAIGMVIFPFPHHNQIWTEGLASLLYFENVELIRSHLAYEAAAQDISLFQHFWSLSIQGQFYLVWPLVALGAYWIAKQFKTNSTRIMAGLLALILIASLAFAVYVGGFAQDEAYLMTRTRAWQFAFGGLVAIVIDRIKIANSLRFIFGYIGLALIATVGFVLDAGQLFPGPWALWPLLGFALVLLAAPQEPEETPQKWSVPHILSNRAFGWVGDHAYGLYLWHWPLLIFYLALRDREAVGVRGGAVIFVTAVVLAVVMHQFIEKPLNTLGQRKRGPVLDWVSLGGGITAAAVGVLLAFPYLPKDGDRVANSLDFDQTTHPGALSISHNVSVEETTPIPELAELAQDHPDYVFRKCQQTMGDAPGTDEVTVCDDPDAPEQPSARVALAAGSHSGHWEAAVRSLGKEYGWEVLGVTKSGCVLQDGQKPETSMCQAWNDNFIDWVAENDIDMVITPGTRVVSTHSNESVTQGAPHRWEQLSDLGVDLLLVRGTPRPVDGGGPCLAQGTPVQDCGVVAGDITEPNPLDQMTLPAGAQTIDMNDYVCPNRAEGADAQCSAVIGNVIVWYDESHLSPEYSYTLAPAFEQEMHEVFPEYFNS